MGKIILFFMLALGVLAPVRPGFADLLIEPTRVVFEGRTRDAVITLTNTADHARSYRLEWIFLKMTESGHYAAISAEDFKAIDGKNMTADEMVRYSPRQVTVAPHDSQRIRLSLRHPAGLPDGEYRAHFAMVPDDEAPSSLEDAPAYLQLHLGFSIPVIVRQGGGIPDIAVENPRFDIEETPRGFQPYLKVDLVPDHADYSGFGRLEVYRLGAEGAKDPVGAVNNIALFPEQALRTVQVPLDVNNVAGGTYQVVYRGLEEYEGHIFADTRLVIE